MSDLRYPIGKFQPPDVYTSALRVASIQEIAAAPAALRRAAEGLNTEQLSTPYRDGGWTVAQVVHHLPDSHMNAYIRFKLALTEIEPTIKPYNESLWASAPDGATTDVGASLDLFDALHRRLGTVLGGLVETDYARTFRHPERGIQTLDRSLALYAWHGRHHVAHITALRARMGW
jgi:hypothetical protein